MNVACERVCTSDDRGTIWVRNWQSILLTARVSYRKSFELRGKG